jgi:hypothetical protein
MGIGRSSRLNGSRTNPKPSSVVTPSDFQTLIATNVFSWRLS